MKRVLKNMKNDKITFEVIEQWSCDGCFFYRNGTCFNCFADMGETVFSCVKALRQDDKSVIFKLAKNN